jgi:hypothetical protein
MPDEKTLPIPVEIPWQLAATTQVLGPHKLPPETTTIALFTYIPKLESLDKDYPDERLVYLKFTVSISPDIPLVTPTLEFSRAMPIWYVIFDLKVTPLPYAEGGIRPYFLAAAPIRRTMLETGVVGGQMFEGESDSVAIGKSGSQMHESGTSDWKVGGSVNLGWIGVGASGSGTSTTTTADRDVVQRVDTTNREASQERKELLSHTTNVNNVLTLLTAKHVGTPYLRFALWPQPLRPLTLDSSDPNLWYAELLNRRSSGIEGMQDFYAVLAIPKALKGFCIEGDLTRFSVMDAAPKEPSEFELPIVLAPWDLGQITNYLHNRNPRGTPLAELDVDFSKEVGPEAIVYDWTISRMHPSPGPGYPETAPYYLDDGHPFVVLNCLQLLKVPPEAPPSGFLVEFPAEFSLFYKMAAEVWLLMKREQYEKALASSPLKFGKVRTLSTRLETCFDVIDSSLKVNKISASAASPKSLSFNADTPGVPSTVPARDLDKYRAAVFAWNALENQLGAQLSAVREWPTRDFRLDDPAVVDIYLRSAAALRENDPANETLDELLRWVKLLPKHVTALQLMKVTDLRGLAAVLDIAPAVERINWEREQLPKQRADAPSSVSRGCNPFSIFWQKSDHHSAPPPPRLNPIPFALSAKDAAEIRRLLGEALQVRFGQAQHKEDAKPT